ncbi:MAG: hypothetical protein RL308_2669 [Bacteroidota bacterium]|jgi:hypothetical protein
MEYKFSVFKDLLKTKDTPYLVDLTKIVNRIKQGKSIEIINRVRSANNKEEADQIKQQLPCILFAGEFAQRNGNGLVKASGLMCLDFDKYENDAVMLEHRAMLERNPHFVLIFTSPSGKGLKGVIRVSQNITKETFPKIFKAFKKEFDYDYWDGSSCNIDRVCYESYDADIYVNENATIYDPVLIDTGYSNHEKAPLIPVTDEDKIIEKIMNFDWKKDFREGERNAFIFDLAGMFCEYGVSQYTAEGYILNNVVIGEFSETEAKTTIKSAYKKRQFGSKYFEDYQKIERVKVDLKKGKEAVVKKHGISEDTFDELKEVLEHEDFWFSNIDKNGKEKITIDALKYKLFLERNGFKKHYPNDSQKPSWVFIESNKVKITSVEIIKDFVLDYLMEKKEFEVWNYCAKYQNLFAENFLLMLESIELKMLNDTRTTSYIAFNNGVLEITKNEIKLVDYIDIDFYIWEEHILKRDFTPLDEFDNDYKKFIFNISNNEPLAIECAIGYLISTYKNRSNNKAIILNDEVISENPEGGTGKGVFVQGINQIRKTSIIDGKLFDGKKSFPYQTVSLDTKILVFDDVVKNFNFEEKFSLVTEGLTLERKNKDAVKLNVHESPKLIISTNYAIRGEGNSHDRRRYELEIAQFYGKDLTPEDEFGRQLFDDWTELDYQKFDNYIVYCLQLFLKTGLVKQNAKNIKMRKFIAETAMEFFDWIKESDNVPRNERNDKKVFFDKFIEEYPDFKKWLTRKKFNIWVQKYCSFMKFEYLSENSNGLQWFMIKNDDDLNNDDDIIF